MLPDPRHDVRQAYVFVPPQMLQYFQKQGQASSRFPDFMQTQYNGGKEAQSLYQTEPKKSLITDVTV